MSESLPFPVQFALATHFTKRVATAEKETLDGLRKAGFELDFGLDGAGIARAYYTNGGGYYIDVGCSQLIIDGKIKLKRSPQGISSFTDRGLVLKDGSFLEADIVVLATGYDNMRTTVRKVLGDKVADRCKDVWDLDEEGELNAVCLFASSYMLYILILILDIRCGGLVAIRASGSWAGIWLCVGSTPSSWRCRLRPLKLALCRRMKFERSCSVIAT